MALEDPKAFVKTLPGSPGVYRMMGPEEEVLYVGKARDLRKRVSSYFRSSGLSPRIAHMVQQIEHVEITVTHTESEALILENNLIKSLQPRYNVLLRDDKSYPYIYLSDDESPRLGFHRGARKAGGRYFGPYPSSGAVRESLNLLQKLFRVRQCENTFFQNRSRPCLQYQIKRCSGPCTGAITPARYQEDVRHTVMFLEGRSLEVTQEIIGKMERASADLDFESAATYRDQVAALKRIQERQYVDIGGGEADVLALAEQGGQACVSVTFIRGGRNLGTRAYFPKYSNSVASEDILSAFVSQFYAAKPIPPAILVNLEIPERDLIESAFAQHAGYKVAIQRPQRGARRRWLQMAELNATDALRRHLLSKATLERQFEALQKALDLSDVPERVECFDISHTMGEATVGACVVFDASGPVKSDYRRYNIKTAASSDDYGALEEALSRRYRRREEEGNGDTRVLPDLLLIDGGKGQLGVAEGVANELSLEGVTLCGVAKGPARKPGEEQLFLSGRKGPTILAPDSEALHLIQRIRDEAHRFAITGHRQRRGKQRTTSTLENIPGVGNKRRQALLKHLGGLQEVSRAGIEDLARVPGISPNLAKKIYEQIHQQEH